MTRQAVWLMAVCIAGQLLVPGAAIAQSGTTPVDAPVSVEDAARLTWRLETRAQGVAALVRLHQASPADVQVRFELGRVLTWEAGTREEGIRLLRSVVADAPERNDAAEALGEVLSWNDQTRGEAVARLRALLETEPTRTSARLKLAEVLSWDPATRDEARGLYARVLQEDRRSVAAAIGLARVLSWSGRYSESRVMYEAALARDPGAQAARVGLAELDVWTGQARASLKTLTTSEAATIDTPAAIRLRADAYAQIGRPARALTHYDSLLAVEPGNDAVRRAANQMRQRVRPQMELGVDGSDESGDASNRVRTSSMPLRFSFHPGQGDAEVSVTAGAANYKNSAGASQDRFAGAGFDLPIGNRVRVNANAIGHDFEYADRTFTAQAQLQVALHDKVDVRFGSGRDQLSSSRLSLAGEFADGVFYGPSFVNQFTFGASARPFRGWDASIQGTRGRIRGVNVADNAREELYAGVGKSFRPGVLTLRPGYSVAWMSYDRDLSGFPATDASGDGLATPGVGGYFSPFRFLNQMVRLDATVQASRWLFIFAGGGVGRQQTEDARSTDFSHRTGSSDAYLGLRLTAGDRVTIGPQINYQNVASAFDRTVGRITIAYGF